MKINWGTGIVLFFAAFITFILFFVVKTFTQNEYDYDLVTEAYYEEELKFQQTINNSENTKALLAQVQIQKVGNELLVEIPNTDNQLIVGKIEFYRPSNDQLDFVKELQSTNSQFTFSEEQLVTGRWNVMLSWSYGKGTEKSYYHKESIYF